MRRLVLVISISNNVRSGMSIYRRRFFGLIVRSGTRSARHIDWLLAQTYKCVMSFFYYYFLLRLYIQNKVRTG